MVATLRVVLDQMASPTDSDLAEASRELSGALVAGAPEGCEVEAIVPSGGTVPEGFARVHRTPLARRELAGAFQIGAAAGIGGGMIHSPTLFAPLVRHDRAHDHDQTVVTVWDLSAWEVPAALPRTTVAWHKAMLKRAAKHADAVVVPTHSLAARVEELGRFGDRLRVIPGASSVGFSVPSDDVGRRRSLGLPEGYVLVAGVDGMEAALAAIAPLDLPVIVLDAADTGVVTTAADAAGVSSTRVFALADLGAVDRAAVYGGALALVAPSTLPVFPWRVVDALSLGVPVIAARSDVHRDVVLDGGALVSGDDLAEGLGAALTATLSSTAAADRFAVLAGDRGRAFSWRDSADKVWALHADI